MDCKRFIAAVGINWYSELMKLDINEALFPQTKVFVDDLQAAVKPKYLLRNISTTLARSQ